MKDHVKETKILESEHEWLRGNPEEALSNLISVAERIKEFAETHKDCRVITDYDMDYGYYSDTAYCQFKVVIEGWRPMTQTEKEKAKRERARKRISKKKAKEAKEAKERKKLRELAEQYPDELNIQA